MTEDDEIVDAFLEESLENLTQLDLDLVALETHPDDAELLGRVFRTVHTIKGTCGFLGFPNLEALTHTGESLLGALRSGEIRVDAGVTTVLLRLGDAIREVLGRIEATRGEGDDPHAELIDLMNSVREAEPLPAATAPPVTAPHDEAETAAVTESSVRIDVAVLDKLLDLVGELVLARSRLAELDADEGEEGELSGPQRQLKAVTAELQASVMQARLQPVGAVLGRLRRVVRDTAAALGKPVRLDLVGEEVSVDRAVNEVLRDALLHLVRNAVDHGIESPAGRQAAGKPAEGVVRVSAFHEGGVVRIEVSDDGGGVDAERLVAGAVKAGLVDAAAAADLSPRDVLQLMFHPGLSTASEITNVSGRGVGMDVVRANLQQIGGGVEIRSEPGLGTTFRLNVPLTLAIMPVLLVTAAGEHYAIPGRHVREVATLADVVDEVDGTRLHRLRGRLLRLAELPEVLGGDRTGSAVVVVELDGLSFGVVVDAVGNVVDAVVKPLPRHTRDIAVFSAVTILPDGRPSLILDLGGLAEAAGVEAAEDTMATEIEVTGLADVNDLLVVSAPDGGGQALRLRTVRRLEQFDAASVEHAGDVEMVQYGNVLLPLLRVSELMSETPLSPRVTEQDPLRAIVCDTSVGQVALVVEGVEDIQPEPDSPHQPASRPGVESCLVVDGRIVELLDIEALVATAGLGRRDG